MFACGLFKQNIRFADWPNVSKEVASAQQKFDQGLRLYNHRNVEENWWASLKRSVRIFQGDERRQVLMKDDSFTLAGLD